MEKIPLPFQKRVFDIVVSILLMTASLPLVVIVVFLMLLEAIFIASSRGPVLYAEKRVSQGEPFTLYKFRIFTLSSLRDSDDLTQTKVLERDSKNLTLTGRLLKQIYFDELPQLWNVLKGEMSMVGPRPTNLINSIELRKEGKKSKFLLKAGLTGYFQSHGNSTLLYDQNQLDMQYAELCKNSSGWKVVFYDINALWLTVLAVLRAEGV